MPLFYKGIQAAKANKGGGENMASGFGENEKSD